MNEQHLATVTVAVTMVVQAAKAIGIPSSFLPVVGLLVGVGVGVTMATAEGGAAALADGASVGILGALAAFGTYSGFKTMGEYRKPQPRDERGRFTSED